MNIDYPLEINRRRKRLDYWVIYLRSHRNLNATREQISAMLNAFAHTISKIALSTDEEQKRIGFETMIKLESEIDALFNDARLSTIKPNHF